MRFSVTTFVGTAGCILWAGAGTARADSSTVQTLQGLIDAGYNIYLSGSMGSAASGYTSGSEGAIAAGGNVYLQNFGAATKSTATGGVGLAVGGNLTINSSSVNGIVDVGGNLAATSAGLGDMNVGGSMSYLNGQLRGSVNVNGNVSVMNAGISGPVAVGGAASFVNANTPASIGKPTAYLAPVDFAATSADMAKVSTYLSAQQTTAGDSFGKNGNGVFVFNSTVAGDNVFNLTAKDLAAFSGSQVLFTSTVAGATDIINIQDSGTLSLPGNFGISYGGTMTDSKVLMNFSNATTLNVDPNVSYDLSILAPNATINTSGGNITGSVFAANLMGSEQLNTANSGGRFSGALPGAVLYNSAQISPAPLLPTGTTPLGLAVLGWFRRGQIRRFGKAVFRRG